MPDNNTDTIPSRLSQDELMMQSLTKKPAQSGKEKTVPKTHKTNENVSQDDLMMQSLTGVKKKEDGEDIGVASNKGASPTQSSSGVPLQSPADNIPRTKQQISGDVRQIVNDHFQGLIVQSAKDKQDIRPVINLAEKGDPQSISILKNKISGVYDQQIKDITVGSVDAIGGYGAGGFNLTQDNQKRVNELTQKKKQVIDTLNEYGLYSTTNYFKKISQNNIDKLDFEQLGKNYSKYFGEQGQSRLEELASKGTTVDAKIANENIKYKNTTIGLNSAIQDTESDYYELQQREQKDPSLRPQLLQKRKELSQLYGKREGLINQFPEVRRQFVAQILGDEISEQNPGFNLYVSKDDIAKAAKSIIQKNPNVPAHFIEDAASLYAQTGGFFGNTSPVPAQGFTGSFNRSMLAFDQSMKGLLGIGTEENRAAEKIANENSAFAKGTAKSGTSPQVMSLSPDGSAYIPKDNSENFHAINFNNAARILGSAIPTIAPFVITEALTGGVGGFVEGAAGGELLGGGAELATLKTIEKAAPFFVSGYDENHDRAGELVKGDTAADSSKRTAVATLMTLGQSLAFGIVGTNLGDVVKSSISRAASKDILQFVDENGIENLSQKSTFKALKDAYVPRLLTALGKDGAKLGIASGLQTAFDDAIAQTVDPNAKGSTPQQYVDAIVQGAMTGIALGLPGHLVTSADGGLSKLNRDALVEAGQNSDKYIKQINDAVDNGSMDRLEANKKIKIIQTAREQVNNQDNYVGKDGKPLSTRQVSRVIADAFLRDATEILPDKKQQDEVRNAAEKRIDEIKKQENWVNIDETPIIKELNIHPEDAEKGGQVSSFKDIDAGEYYTVTDEGKEKSMSGSDVIELINDKAKNYTHEENKDAEGKGSQDKVGETKIPEGQEGKDPVIISSQSNSKDNEKRQENRQESSQKNGEEGGSKEANGQESKDDVNTPANPLEKGTAEPKGETVPSIDPLKDVENTSRALNDVLKEQGRDSLDYLYRNVPDKFFGDKNNGRFAADSVSDAYHEAKKTGSNTELVKDVEELLKPKQDEPTTIQQPNTSEEKAGIKVNDQTEATKPDNAETNEVKPLTSETKVGDKVIIDGKEGEVTDIKDGKAFVGMTGKDGKNKGAWHDIHEPAKTDTGDDNKPPVKEPPVTSQSPNTEDRLITGIRNSVIDKENIHGSVEPYLKTIKRKWSDLWNSVSKDVESGVLNSREFVREQVRKLNEYETSGKPNKKLLLTDYENAVMLYDRVKLLNDLKNREDALKTTQAKLSESDNEENKYAHEKLKQDIRNIGDELRNSERVLRSSGKATAQALASRQMMADMYGKLVSWEDYITQQYDGNPPPEMLKKARAWQESHQKIQDELNTYYEGQLKKAADEAFKKGFDEAKKQGVGSDKPLTNKEKNKRLSVKLRTLADSIETSETLTKFGIGTAKGAEGAETAGGSIDLRKAIADAVRLVADGIEKGERIGKLINDAIKKHLPQDGDEKEFRDALKTVLSNNGIQSEQDKLLANIKDDATAAKSTSIVSESVNDIKKLMNGLIRDGEANTLAELTTKTKELLKDIYPDNTEREIRDLYSGYGLTTESRSEIEKKLFDTKQEAKTASELEDLLKPVSGETPLQEKARYDKINKLLPKVEQYMKEKGVTIEVAPYNDAQRVQIVLDASTNRIKSFIDGMGNKIAQESKELRDANENVENNSKIKELNGEKDFLNNRLSEIIDTKLTEAQKVQRIDALLRNQKSKLERRLREGTNPLIPEKDKLSAGEQYDLRERIKEYNKQVRGLKEDLTPDAEKETGALNTYKERLSQEIAKLESRIKNKDFSDEPIKEKKDPIKDKKAAELELKLRMVENDYFKLKRVADEHGKSTYKKVLDTFNNYIRFNVLSNYMTLAKLGMAVAENMVFTPTEQAIGMGYSLVSKIPIAGLPLKILMGKAERHGYINPKQFATTEWAALKATFTSGAKDAWQELKHNNSELGILYGDESQIRGVPPEYRDIWYKVNNALGSAARLHGAEKAFFKRNEFTRSYLLRKFSAERNGKNVNDPVIQQEMALAAYQDSMTSILMGDNKLYNIYKNWFIKGLDNADNPYASGLSSLLNFLTPVVKVPSNLVLMGGRASFGWLAGGEIGIRSLVSLMSKTDEIGGFRGIKSLDAKESDALMRNLKKGTLGGTLIMLGFLRPDIFGSSTFYKRGVTGDNELEEGEVTFFGVKLPKWATDNPYFWAMKLGASARHFYDYYTKQKNASTATAIGRTAWDVAVGGATEIPTLGTWSDLSTSIRNPESTFSQGFLYNQLTKLSPASGLTRQIAKDTDKDSEGKEIKRKPTSIGEAFEMLYPGARQTVQPK